MDDNVSTLLFQNFSIYRKISESSKITYGVLEFDVVAKLETKVKNEIPKHKILQIYDIA